ncbi:hypothetical protein D9758_011924 [Tetrapyrgos nigripes]|uniref:Uncharacterized protein n=1 Tax=Tetrapyrgos nigripes TaxID=182062 RepID=A0A8H5FX08_9AGAR|nr:hypothetical protein D9758_011924 [Tetrapyrgos nigripes]
MSAINLQGKIALVTGGGTGIGLMIAKELSKNGAKVYITGRRLQVLQKTATETGVGLIPLQMDVSDKESIANAVKTIDQAEGKLDILVNNAGIGGPHFDFLQGKDAPKDAKVGDSAFAQDSFEQWAEVFKTNTAAPYFVTMGFLSLLERGARTREGETSSVIIISSVGGVVKLLLGGVAYPVSKAGVNHLTEVLATQFALQNIPVRVNALSPGFFPSQMTEGLGLSSEQINQWAAVPAKGLFNAAPILRAGTQLEIGTAVAFLSSAAGEFVNGVNLPIDGGISLVNP